MLTFARLALRRAAVPALLAAVVVSGCSTVSLDEPIEARAWQLASIDAQPVIPNADPNQRAQITFDGGAKRVSGSGGCNRISGSYVRTGTSLKIGPVVSTRMACIDPGRGQLEARFLAVLQATASYSVSGTELVLLDAQGQTLAKLDSSGR